MSWSTDGNFFEDFIPGTVLRHATPRTVTTGDVALYTALTGSRFAINSADTFAQQLGLMGSPLDDILVFNIVFGKTVPDISLNAIANLGYASGRFGKPVYPGDTLKTESRVIGRRELSNGKAGIVWVRSIGTNQFKKKVLDYVRWVMVNKRDPESPAPDSEVPDLPQAVGAQDLTVPKGLDLAAYDTVLAGDERLWDDFNAGDRIDHVDGMTLEEAEHQMATRLYQNTAKVHFNQHQAHDTRFGRRIVYGGHVISLARALSFNGLANAFRVAAINGGRHVAPFFAGDTLYAWSQVLAKEEIDGRQDVGALRIRMIGVKDHLSGDYPDKDGDDEDHPGVVLDFDMWVLMPRAV
ncbi:MAG: MaoC family dehydratase [Pseudomonadota bacterium]